MELLSTIHKASELTDEILDLLGTGDPALIGPVLEERQRSLEEFEAVHRAADTQERNECAEVLHRLQQADKELRNRSQEILALVAGEFREQLGWSSRGRQKNGSDPLPGCVDRKA
jgi:hypothetical protein